MNRRKFIGIAGGTVLTVGAASYLLSDKSNLVREDIKSPDDILGILTPVEKEILFHASLAPSGHNTQPWFVINVEPFHWIIGNDKARWLPAVDPAQRETILSIGAFMQNLEYAAETFGYVCDWKLIAATNQDREVMEVKLIRSEPKNSFDLEKIKTRRTLRSNFLSDKLKKEDLEYIAGSDAENFHYLPAESKESDFINEQTIEANCVQSYRDPAQQELAEWMRFSNKDAEKYRDGLTTGSMEIEGFSGWIVRNFYGKTSAMKNDFREQGIDKVRKQVTESAGWILITSKNDDTPTLLETGKKLQKFLLKIREKNIAIHPMTQILEESATKQNLNQSIGINENIQFILRAGYVKNYPPPVSLRRPVDWFLQKG